MSVGRKMFLGFSMLLLVMGTLSFAGTYSVVDRLMSQMAEATQREVMDRAVGQLVSMYDEASGWSDLLETERFPLNNANDSVLIIDANGESAARIGELGDRALERFGMKKNVTTEDGRSWTIYYANSAIHFVGLFKYAFRDSLVLLLVGLAVLLTAVALVAAYGLARHLTAPIRRMIPVIDQLGAGQYQAKVKVDSKDEFGRIAAALNNLSAGLEQAEHARKTMTADIAHELRTPLSIIGGRLDYYQQSGRPVPPEQLLPLQDELIRLERIVNELQELSRAEADQLILQKEPVDIAELLGRIVEKVQLEAEEHGLTITLSTRPAFSSGQTPICLGDRHRLTQVFLNLLMNAIRYTPSGGTIEVTVAAEPDDLLVSVADTGIGLAPEHLPHLFQRFYRADPSRDRHSGGSGLGLAIAAEYVRAHGGEITAESELGKGSVFQVRLPRDQANSKQLS